MLFQIQQSWRLVGVVAMEVILDAVEMEEKGEKDLILFLRVLNLIFLGIQRIIFTL